MRPLLTTLGVVGLVIVIAGAVNHAIGVRIDYLVGTAPSLSLFWFAVAVAVLIVAAGLVGALVGRSGANSERGKLEAELEDTYRRLRAAQAQAPARIPEAQQTSVALRDDAQPFTIVEPAQHESQTSLQPAPVEPETSVKPAPD